MADSRMREDVESAYLDISEFVGQSLTGPRELITRKVLCSNVQQIITEAQAVTVAGGGVGTAVRANAVANALTQLSFRILSTSPGAMLNAKVVLTLPLIFHHAVSHTAGDGGIANYAGAGAGVHGWTATNTRGQIAPRRNGILKACRSLTSTINSTVSFTVRPDEGLDVMEQMFTQEGVSGQTGIYNDADSSDCSWGNTDGCVGRVANVGAHPNARVPALRVRQIFNPFECNGTAAYNVNRGFLERRQDFKSGGGANFADGTRGGVNDVQNNVHNFVRYDYKTTLCIPPFKTFNKDIYSRSASWIPYCDSCDLQLSFKPYTAQKAALIAAASVGDGDNLIKLDDYDYGLAAQPFLTVEWCVPPVALRPSYTLPCWRNQHYSQRITFTADDTSKALTFQGIRTDALPSLISMHVTDAPAYKVLGRDGTPQAEYNWTEYFGTMRNFRLTANEKLSIMSDKSEFDLYKLYRMYAPDSKMSYTVWRELRQVILIRSDVLALEKGQAVFNPSNLTINCDIGKQINFIGAVWQGEVHLNFWYFNDALTLSQQAAAVTSMLLSPSDVQQLRVSPEAADIQTLMQMGLQG